MRVIIPFVIFLCTAVVAIVGTSDAPSVEAPAGAPVVAASGEPAGAAANAPSGSAASEAGAANAAAASNLAQEAADLFGKGKYAKALAAADRAIELGGETEALVELKCDAYWKLGWGEPWLAAALRLEEIAQRKTPWHCLKIAEAHLLLGHTEPALEWIRKAVEERDFSRYQIFEAKAYDALRGDARFGQLVARAKARVGLDKPAADFTVTLLDGTPLSLSALRGKVVLVDFWASWCAPCKRELPDLQKLYRESRERGLEIVAISLDEDKEVLARYVRDKGLAWKIGFSGRGWQDETARRYGVNSLPAKYLIDRQGTLRQFNLSGDELTKAVLDLLGS